MTGSGKYVFCTDNPSDSVRSVLSNLILGYGVNTVINIDQV
jgi:hypothetical protein